MCQSECALPAHNSNACSASIPTLDVAMNIPLKRCPYIHSVFIRRPRVFYGVMHAESLEAINEIARTPRCFPNGKCRRQSED